MIQRITVLAFLFASLVFTGAVFAVCDQCRAKALSKEEVATLIAKVQRPDWSEQQLHRLFSHISVRRVEDTFALNVEGAIKLTHDRYSHFTEPYAVNKLRKFMRQWRTVLKRAESKFDVDKEVIAAILLVETSFGRFKGDYQLLSVFASLYLDTLALIDSEKFRDYGESMQKRIKRKNAWALGELQALLAIARSHELEILQLRGSFAGAFGICQFLPSSYQRWAVAHHKQARRPDLFWVPDAIYSVGNYLREHGYGQGKKIADKEKAIWAYNNSKVYVDTVLNVAKRAVPR